jgi:hypothetical protein
METKKLYDEGIWEKIESHPDYDLGRRELEALIRFIPAMQSYLKGEFNALHLGVATGREVPHLISAIQNVKRYTLVDICRPVLQKTFTRLKSRFPRTNFHAMEADIERPGRITHIRQTVHGNTLFILVGNCSIFSNYVLDTELLNAMEANDLFLLTSETPHPDMYRSYQIEPVYKFLNSSELKVNQSNTRFSYNEANACLEITCKSELLLASYKPAVERLHQRMRRSGFTKVALEEYVDIHMIGSLWRRA